MNKLFTYTALHKNLGLLFIRLGIGIMFILHGEGKMFGGPELWEKLGGSMSHLGIDFLPVFWGFMAAFAEFFGGIMLFFGFFFRPACFLLLCTMIVATARHVGAGDHFNGYSHALEAAILFLGLMFTGPGEFSIDKRLFNS